MSFERLEGTSLGSFVLQLDGPRIKRNGTAIQARNNADSGFAELEALSPTGPNGVATKAYVDSREGTVIVTLQHDGTLALPSTLGSVTYYVVTTSGGFASIGDLLFDDGVTVSVLAATTGREISTAAAFSGGTISLDANSQYLWDGAAWVKIGDVGGFSGAMRQIRFTINNAASQNSVSDLPANSVVERCVVKITTQYSAGATLSVGWTGNTQALQSVSDNDPEVLGTYGANQDTEVGGSTQTPLVTIGGSPAAGAGVVVINYSVPDA